MRRLNERTLSDERILGTGHFVAAIVEQADESLKRQFRAKNPRQRAEGVIDEVCRREKASVQDSCGCGVVGAVFLRSDRG